MNAAVGGKKDSAVKRLLQRLRFAPVPAVAAAEKNRVGALRTE